MIEWEFAEERPLPALPPGPEPRRTWSRRQRSVLFLVAALFFAIAAGTVWRTVQHRQQALHADLQAVVLAEERARAFRQTHQLAQLVVSDAPAAWSQAYAAHFANSAPIATALSDVSFDDQAALVTLVVTPTSGAVLAPHLEARFYRFDGSHWKRAPLPAERWGRQASLTVEPFFVVSYRSRDSTFAHGLASDMQRLEARVTRQWGQAKRPREFRVDIIPQELSGPLFYRQAEHVAVNSPSLAIPFSSILTPEDEIRVAVGQALIRALTEQAPVALLRHRENARLVLAALRRAEVRHALLSPTALAAYQAQRRAELADGWVAPLITAAAYGPSTYPDTIRAQNSADLLADYVVASYGPDGLGRLARAVQRETTWDQVLQHAFGTDMHTFLAAARDFGLGVAAGERPARWSQVDG
ncbi:MAG TPA: hypothetical protein VER55_07275, partial [Ardenticatenaceae bacterium]|nr:hypothetical protein [Ardenticatenaceae bacterium]